MNRMTGNWWFPLDVWVVVQANQDLKYFAPGIVGAVYAWGGGGTYTSPPGAFDVMFKNADSTWSRTTKDGTLWHFNVGGYLDYIRNRYGRQTTIQRDAAQKILSWSDFAGRTTTVSYYANGYASAMTDWGGRQVAFSYTAQGYLLSVSYPATTFFDSVAQAVVTRGKTIAFQYTVGTGTANDGNLLYVFDDVGASSISNTFDALDRTTSSTSRGRLWTYSYLSSGATRVVDADGVTVDYSFDATGRVNRKEVWTRSGMGLPALRLGEPASYVWQYEHANACNCGLLTKLTYPDGSTVALAYDAWGDMTSRVRTDAAASQSLTEAWTYSSFVQYCRMTSYTMAGGYAPGAITADHRVTVTYDSQGSATQIIYPKASVNGVLVAPTIDIVRNALGQVTSYVGTDGVVTSYSYVPGTLELASVIRNPGGLNVTTTYTWDVFSRMSSFTSPRGFVTAYEYNALDQLTQMTGPQPKAPIVRWMRDERENVYQVEVENRDSSGTVIVSNPWITATSIFDANNRLWRSDEEIDAGSVASTRYEYTSAGRLAAIVDPMGGRTEYTYDERGLSFKVTVGAGTTAAGTTTTSYDVVGRCSSTVDALGVSTSYAFDFASRLQSVAHPDGRTDTAVWDEDGRKVMFISTAEGVVRMRSRWSYDPIGQTLTEGVDLLSATGALIRTPTTTFRYADSLRLVAVQTPTGETVSWSRDALGRVTTVEDPVQGRVEQAYDPDGNVTQTTRRDWNPTTQQFESIVDQYSWDELGLVTSRTRAGGSAIPSQSWLRSYDGLGRVVATTDAVGNTTSNVWDARSLPISTTRDLRAGGTGAGGVVGTIVTATTYDALGRTVARIDGMGHSTTYAYDARSRVTSTTSAAGTTSIVYDAASNAVSVTDPLGTMVTSGYDSMGRVTTRSVARAAGVLGTTAESYQYDAMGRTTSAADDDSSVARTYDSLGRTTTETQNGRTFSYTYDDSSRLTSITYPDGAVESRQTDAAGRLTSVAIQNGPTLATYQSVGSRVLAESLGSGVQGLWGYDGLRRGTSVEYALGATSLKKFSYGWIAADQRAYEKRHHAGGTGDTYGFDSLYRRIQVKEGVADPAAEFASPGSQATTSVRTIAYDAANSRATEVVTGAGAGTTAYAADGLNFYTNVGGVAHARDANGNRRDDGNLLFTYDYRNQLVEARNKATNAIVATYQYDALGRRVAKTVGAATRTFAWLGYEVGVEYDALGVFSRRHYGPFTGQVAAAWHRDQLDLDGDGSTTDSVWVYPLYDGAFDCVGLCGPAGNVVESYVSSYAGAMTITNAVGNAIAPSALGWQQGYAGYYRDDETGLQYATLRYYDPETGRFTTEDPIGRWGDGANLGDGYAFLGNRYRNSADPFGLASCPCGEKYVIFEVDTEPFHDNWIDLQTNSYLGDVADMRASVEASGYKVRLHNWTFQYSKDQMRERYEKFKTDIEASKTNPCFAGFVGFGHSSGRGSLTIFGNQQVTAWDLYAGRDHPLDFVFIYGCGGGAPMQLPKGVTWASNVADPSNCVVATEDIKPINYLPDNGEKLVRAGQKVLIGLKK